MSAAKQRLVLAITAALLACSDGAGPTAPRTRYLAVAAGGGFTCALDDARNTWCWGQAGFVNDSVPYLLDTPEPLVEIRASGYGFGALCGRSESNRVFCWGSYLVWHTTSPYGNGTDPFEITGLSDVTRLALGEGHGCALAADSTVSCWGSYVSGKRGRTFPSPFDLYDVEAAPASGALAFTQLALGSEHSCGVLFDGQVACWGDSAFVGNPGADFEHAEDPCWIPGVCRLTPVAVVGVTGATRVEAGRSHTCVLAATGLKCWGDNFYHELGSVVGVHSDLPVVVNLPETAVDLTLGGNHSCALTALGSVYCWGNLSWTQGNPQPSGPTRFRAGSHRFTALSAGDNHTCGIVEDGAVYCWGGSGPALGDGTGKSSPQTPVRVAEPPGRTACD